MTQLEAADYGTTDQAFNADAGRYANDDTLHVKFFTHPRQHPAKSEEEGRPIFEDTHYVQIMQPGNKDNIVIRPATEMDKARFAERYKKFLAREDQEAVEGTLLEEWPGITRSQVEELKYLNIRTVEQLAAVSDANSQSIMGIQMLKSKAAKYLEAADSGKAAAIQAKNEETIAALMARIEAMEKGTAVNGPGPETIKAEEVIAVTEVPAVEVVTPEAIAKQLLNPETEETVIEPAPEVTTPKTTRRSRKA